MAVKNKKKNNKAWVITVDMGYGHQRATYPLRHVAHNDIVNANTYPGIPESDRSIWEHSRQFYEFISRFSRVPVVGQPAFELYDKFQSIPDFYPKRDLSRPSFQLKEIYSLLENKQWGRHLIEKLNKSPRPLITSFFAIAFMAEYFNYQGEIYCVICDADISRVWADEHTTISRINYLAPCYRVAERLKLYGVQPERIFLTGFPLPKENLGGSQLKTLRHDLSHRIVNLDPLGRYARRYGATAVKQLKLKGLPAKSDHPLTLTMAVGGAGAQKDIIATMIVSLRQAILKRELRVNLVAGVHESVKKYFEKVIKENGLNKVKGESIKILFSPNKFDYFEQFNVCLRQTDILWTKPSELSFYSALGLPIVIAPPIGSQEKFNRLWLKTIGAGISQEEPQFIGEWLFDWLKSGWLAQAAMRGFLEAPRLGTYNIEEIAARRPESVEEMRSVLQY